MIKSITLRAFPPAMPWRECLRAAKAAGYDGVEVNFDGRFALDCPARMLADIRRAARRNGLVITSVYARQQWQFPLSSGVAKKREEGRQVVVRLLEIAEALEADAVLVIPGAVDNSVLARGDDVEIVPYEAAYERVGEALAGLAETARRRNVALALENVGNKFLLSPLEMRDFIDRVASPFVGSYFDVANCLFTGGYPEQWIAILAGRIKAVHVKDYRLAAGNVTGFTNIFEGDVRWDKVCAALAATGYDGPLTVEVLPAFRHHPDMLWQSAGRALDCMVRDITALRRKAGTSRNSGRRRQAT